MLIYFILFFSKIKFRSSVTVHLPLLFDSLTPLLYFFSKRVLKNNTAFSSLILFREQVVHAFRHVRSFRGEEPIKHMALVLGKYVVKIMSMIILYAIKIIFTRIYVQHNSSTSFK